jgi:hypothetical protein
MRAGAGFIFALLLATQSVAAELAWFRANAPTPQALALVRELGAAEREGLRSADCSAAAS